MGKKRTNWKIGQTRRKYRLMNGKRRLCNVTKTRNGYKVKVAGKGTQKPFKIARKPLSQFQRGVLRKVVKYENNQGYDKDGNLIYIKSPNKSNFGKYDKKGRITEMEYTDGRKEYLEYGKQGGVRAHKIIYSNNKTRWFRYTGNKIITGGTGE